MKTWKRAIGSFVFGLVVSLGAVAAYAECPNFIWVADNPDDCRYLRKYDLSISVTGGEVEICVYTPTSMVHFEDGPCGDLIFD